MALFKELVEFLSKDYESESWFETWKNRGIENEKDEELWEACKDMDWRTAERLIDEGAQNDFIEGAGGGISALWILQFYNQTRLADKMKNNFENLERKTNI